MIRAPLAELKSSLGSSNRYKRAEAAIALGENEVMSELPALRALTDDDDSIVALAAMYACWKLGQDAISVDRFIEALKSGDEELIQQAVHTVCAIGQPMVLKLKPLLRTTPANAMLALRLLDDIGGHDAIQAIRTYAGSDREVVAMVREILEDQEDGSA